MSVYPVMLEGEALSALIVGGGAVATRKARSLLASGASVRVVAPDIDPVLQELASVRLALHRHAYSPNDIGDAILVIAATSARDVNARVARDARERGRLVVVADAPDEGNCTTPAVHRAGDLIIAVSAGHVPAVAARIRDSLARRYDDHYANAVAQLAAVRSRFLRAGDREGWRSVADSVVDDNFCEAVERGELSERMAAWR